MNIDGYPVSESPIGSKYKYCITVILEICADTIEELKKKYKEFNDPARIEEFNQINEKKKELSQ